MRWVFLGYFLGLGFLTVHGFIICSLVPYTSKVIKHEKVLHISCFQHQVCDGCSFCLLVYDSILVASLPSVLFGIENAVSCAFVKA